MFLGDCPEVGVDFGGHDLRQVQPVTSWEACGNICNDDAACFGWGYGHATFPHDWGKKKCFLKTQTYEAGRGTNAEVTSGSKGCPAKGKNFNVL